MQYRTRVALRWLPYVLPFALFLVLTSSEQSWGLSNYPFVYTAKIALVTSVLWYLWRFYPELGNNRTGITQSLLLGPLLTVAWVVIDRFTPHFSFLGARSSFNPFESITNRPLAWVFICIRFFGLTLIAPLVEELFYRAFLLKWITNTDDFKRVPLGEYTPAAFAGVVVLMASAHPEYLAAAFFSAAMNLLLNKTRNLWATVAAHGSTNFCLGVYVLSFHAWKYW